VQNNDGQTIASFAERRPVETPHEDQKAAWRASYRMFRHARALSPRRTATREKAEGEREGKTTVTSSLLENELSGPDNNRERGCISQRLRMAAGTRLNNRGFGKEETSAVRSALPG